MFCGFGERRRKVSGGWQAGVVGVASRSRDKCVKKRGGKKDYDKHILKKKINKKRASAAAGRLGFPNGCWLLGNGGRR